MWISYHVKGSSGGRVVKLLPSEQEVRGSIPDLATWIFRDWLSPASKSRYDWKIAKSTLILKTTNQPTTYHVKYVPIKNIDFDIVNRVLFGE